MDSGFYAACTALMARTEALDSLANNLANSNTSGYKEQRNLFRSVLANVSTSSASPLNVAMNDYGVLGGTQLNMSEGSMEHTANDLDFALQGSGFFVVQTPTGRVYTRSGNFMVAKSGQLITQQGDPVMGDNGVINVSGGKVNLGPDGTLSVNGAIAGKVKIVDFKPGTEISSLGKSYYSAPAGAEVAATKTQVQQGFLEASNVNPMAEAVELINVQREAEMMQRAINFNSDLNKTATEDLPRL